MSGKDPSAPTVPRPRIEGLSDLIFGLALSIGAIQLVGNPPSDQGQLILALGAFGFSFLILIAVWNRYTTLVSVVPVETVSMVRLNMTMLFFVAVEPYLFNLLVIQKASAEALAPLVSALYGLDIGGMNYILAYFTHVLTKDTKHNIPDATIQRFKLSRDSTILVATLFAISAIPAFWTLSIAGVQLRFILWLIAIPAGSLARLFTSRRRHEQEEPEN